MALTQQENQWLSENTQFDQSLYYMFKREFERKKHNYGLENMAQALAQLEQVSTHLPAVFLNYVQQN